MSMSFKDWMLFTEESYTKADIPEYFYVGIYFSEDLVKSAHSTARSHPTDTRAVASLQGVEGITSNPRTAGSFHHGAALKMPGKAVLEINKVSKGLYNNPHYQASAGFRSARRFKSGGDFLHSNTRAYQSVDILRQVLSNVFEKIEHYFANDIVVNNKVKVSDGSFLSLDDVIQMLQKLNPAKINKHPRPWKRSKKNNIKSIRNANDLAARLAFIIKSAVGEKYSVEYKTNSDEKGTEKDEFVDLFKTKEDAEDWIRKKIWNQDKEYGTPKITNYKIKSVNVADRLTKKNAEGVSLLHKWIQENATTVADYGNEEEWTIKRTPLGRDSWVKKCPNCGRYNEFDPYQMGEEIRCKSCTKEFKLEDPVERGALPVLHVPRSSTLFIDVNATPMKWMDKYIPNKLKNATDIDKYKYIVNEFKLYNKYKVHFLKSISDLNEEKPRSHDPERENKLNSIKEAIMRGVTNVKLLERLMQYKGITPETLKEVLDRWEKAKIIKIEQGQITMLDPNTNDDMQEVYMYIKSHSSDEVEARDIESELNLDEDSLHNAIKKLIKKGLIKETSKNLYTLNFSEEEKQHLNDQEKKALEVIKNHSVSDYYDISGLSSKDSISALKSLKLKGKIFRSKLTGYYKPTLPSDIPLDEEEQKVLDYLKKWPVSDRVSLEKNGFKKYNLSKALDDLTARNLITLNSNVINLNKDIVKDFNPNAKDHSWAAGVIMHILKRHFVTSGNLKRYLKKWDSYTTEKYVSSLVNLGFIEFDENGRLIPVNYNKSIPTVEEKFAMNLLHQHDFTTTHKMAEEYSKITGIDHYQAEDIFDRLMATINNKVNHTTDPISQNTYYYLGNKEFKADISKYEKSIVELLSKKGTPVTFANIYISLYDDYAIHGTSAQYILGEMVKEGKLKSAENFASIQMYYLPTQEPPKPIEYWHEVVKKMLQEHGPMSNPLMKQNLRYEKGLDEESMDYLLNDIVKNAIVMGDWSELMRALLWHLPEQKLPTEEDFEDKLSKILAKGPHTLDEIGKELGTLHNATSKIVLKMAQEGKIKKNNVSGKEVWHLVDYDIAGQEAAIKKEYENEVINIVNKAGGSLKLMDIHHLLTTVKPIGTYTNFTSLIEDMVKNKSLYLKKGDLDDGSWDAIVSTSPVETINQVKPIIIQCLQSGPIQLSKVAATVFEKTGTTILELKPAIDHLLQTGEIHIVVPKTGQFWSQIVSLEPPATPTIPNPAVSPNPNKPPW